MSDFNKPVTGDTYVDHFQDIRDLADSLVKMLDGTSDTNLPSGAKRRNSGQKYRLEEWNGTSWNTVVPGFGGMTQAEVNQLENIGSVTISNTQWGWVGGLSAQPIDAAGDGTSKSGGTLAVDSTVARTNSTNEFTDTQIISRAGDSKGWVRKSTDDTDARLISVRDSGDNSVGRIDIKGFNGSGASTTAIFRDFSDVQIAGNSILDTSNLAANGASVPEVDRTNTFTQPQNIHNTLPFLDLKDTDGPTDEKTIRYQINNGELQFFVSDDAENNFTKFVNVSRSGITPSLWDFQNIGVVLGSLANQGDGTLNGELYDNGNRVARQPSGSSDNGRSLDTWYNPNSTFATAVCVTGRVRGGNGSAARIAIDVDDSGGSTADYSLDCAYVDDSANTDTDTQGTATAIVPPGGSFQIRNALDPNNINTIQEQREITL